MICLSFGKTNVSLDWMKEEQDKSAADTWGSCCMYFTWTDAKFQCYYVNVCFGSRCNLCSDYFWRESCWLVSLSCPYPMIMISLSGVCSGRGLSYAWSNLCANGPAALSVWPLSRFPETSCQFALLLAEITHIIGSARCDTLFCYISSVQGSHVMNMET